MKLVPAVSGIACAVLIGVSLATFRYAEGFSYLSTDPSACANCHTMTPQYDSWLKSSHQRCPCDERTRTRIIAAETAGVGQGGLRHRWLK